MSNNLGRTEVAASQTQKEVTINDSDGRIDAALTETLDLDFTSADVTLTTAQFQTAFRFNATNLSTARALTVPAVKRFFFVDNTDGTATLTVTRGTTTIDVEPGENGLFYSDGTTDGLVQASGGGGGGGGGSSTFVGLSDTPANYTGAGGQALRVNSGASAVEFIAAPYDIGGAYGGASIGSSEIVLQYVFPRATSVPSGATNSQGKSGTAATAQTDFSLQKNGVSFGTMRFAAAATTATFVSVSATSFAAGDELRIVAPSSADATLADIVFTIAGVQA